MKAWRRSGGGATNCTLRTVSATDAGIEQVDITWSVVASDAGQMVRVSLEGWPAGGELNWIETAADQGMAFLAAVPGTYRVWLWRLDEGRACAQPSNVVVVNPA